MATELRTVCTRDCPDSCSIIATVEDGRITGHRGDPAHEVTRGFLCWRGNHYLRRFYHPIACSTRGAGPRAAGSACPGTTRSI